MQQSYVLTFVFVCGFLVKYFVSILKKDEKSF